MEYKGFTLIELMVVILIIGILAAASIPLMRRKIEDAKWTESRQAAGIIRRAVKMYHIETGQEFTGVLGSDPLKAKIGLAPGDLIMTYFNGNDFRVLNVDSKGLATIQVTARMKRAGFSGQKTFYPDGRWE